MVNNTEKNKQCKVVMLPNPERNLPTYRWGESILTKDKDKLDFKKYAHATGLDVFQHIYFTSEDAIAQGDWYIQPEGLRKSAAKTDTCVFPKDSYKVVASTDSSLGLPMIPESFIKDYVELNGAITHVNLAMFYGEPLDNKPWEYDPFHDSLLRLSMNANNEVVVLRHINMNQNLQEIFGTPLCEKFGVDGKDITVEGGQVIINKDTDSAAPIKIPMSSHSAFTPEDIRADSDRLYPEPTKQRGVHGQLVPSSSYWEERQAYVRGRMDERELKDCTNGIKVLVGNENGNPLFVKGSYDAIILLQKQLIELDTLRTKYLKNYIP